MSTDMQDSWQFVDADVVERVRQLEIFSRFRVESLMYGTNRSPFRGFTADFLQHRPYFRGDSLKYLDWRVYGKTGRLHVREYEELTNAPVSFLVDISNSMAYRGPDGTLSKHDFSVRCAAVLIYMAFLHRDSFSLTLFNRRVTRRLPFGGGKKHLQRLLRELIEARPGEATDFPAALREATAPIRRKGLTVVISDFMDDAERIVHTISHLRFAGSDIIAMQVFDRAEREMDFNSVTRFHDLESQDILVIDPPLLRREYMREFDLHQVEVKEACRRHGFDHVILPVQDDYDVPLLDYVRRRMELFS
jgi:uncharacterized protein (DUF58 family)